MSTNKKKRLKKKYSLILLFIGFLAVFIVLEFVFNPKNDGNDKTTIASKTFTKTDNSGKCDYVLMKTGNINQIKIGAYQACETVSLYNALVYFGKTQGQSAEDLINDLPLVGWGGDPDSGYAGDPWTANEDIPDGGFPTIWPEALMAFAQSKGLTVANLSGQSLDVIKASVLKEHIVEMWVTIDFATPAITYTDYYGHEVVANTHAVLLDGYDVKKKEFHVTDPIKGKYWLDEATVGAIYQGTNQFALEFLG